jgi:hypothetical protein
MAAGGVAARGVAPAHVLARGSACVPGDGWVVGVLALEGMIEMVLVPAGAARALAGGA